MIGSVSNGCYSIRLYFESVIFSDACYDGSHSGSGRLVTVRLKIGYSSYRVSISSVSIEVRVEIPSISGCHRLISDSVLPNIDRVRVFSSRIRL